MFMFDFTAPANWSGIYYFGVIAVLLLLGNTLRRKVPFFRNSLLPTAVIAGFIGLILKETVYAAFVSPEQVTDMNLYFSMITYHALAIGFIALGLKVSEKTQHILKRGQSLFSGMLIVATYLLQGFLGLGLTLFMSYTFLPDLFKSSGIIFPLGFGQGPGQALNIGTIYENTYGFVGGGSFGLAIASFGFLWASIFGVIYLNILAKKGLIPARMKKNSVEKLQLNTSDDEIPLAESIDKFTVQVGIVLFVYLITYGFIFGVNEWLASGVLGDFGINTVGPLLWGFNFIFGMLFALLLKRIFIFLREKNIMTRQYPNNFLLNRITGFVFDLMIVASITAIRVSDLSTLWFVLLSVGLVVGLATVYFVTFLARHIYPSYQHEATLGMFGMLSGTASTGVILIREIDPEFKTPAVTDLVVGSSTAILFGFPILLLVGLAPVSDQSTWIVFGIVTLMLILFTGALLFFNKKEVS
jgi:ESS family glutamate:Na+ symporter